MARHTREHNRGITRNDVDLRISIDDQRLRPNHGRRYDVLVLPEIETELGAGLRVSEIDDQRHNLAGGKPVRWNVTGDDDCDLDVSAGDDMAGHRIKRSWPNCFGRDHALSSNRCHVPHRKISG